MMSNGLVVCLSECGSECDTCFDKNFCTRCRAGSYLHKGKCQESCPGDLVPNDIKRECVACEYPFLTVEIYCNSVVQKEIKCLHTIINALAVLKLGI